MRSQVWTQRKKKLLACRKQPKVVLQTYSKPASYLQALERKLKVSRISPKLSRRKRNRSQAGPKVEKFARLSKTAPSCSADSHQACESFASIRSQTQSVPSFVHAREGETHAQVCTQSGKRCLAFWNRPKLFLQTHSKPLSHFQALDRKLKASRTSRTLGRGKRKL